MAGGYANLRSTWATGGRGFASGTLVAPRSAELTGAEAGLAVGQQPRRRAWCSSLSALAAGREVVVSRGQLVEIGDGFRIPDILRASAAPSWVEVGTTNRTTARRLRGRDRPETALLLRVHPSNYRVVGFTEEVGTELGGGRRRRRAGLDDLGSGLLRPTGVRGEPDARSAIAGGATLICFSGDKLLGGPQADHRRHPGAVDRSGGTRWPAPCDRQARGAALEETLRLHRDPERARAAIPVLRMAHEPAGACGPAPSGWRAAIGGEVADTEARVGGGSMPALALRRAPPRCPIRGACWRRRSGPAIRR